MSVDRDWMRHAKCRDMDPKLFDSDNRGAGQQEFVRKVCAECPVIRECAAYHLKFQTSGVVVAGIPIPDMSSTPFYRQAMDKLKDFDETGDLAWMDDAEPTDDELDEIGEVEVPDIEDLELGLDDLDVEWE